MIKYFRCENLEKTGLVDALYTAKFDGHWRIFSLNKHKEDLKYYEELARDFNIKPENMVRIPQKHTDNIRIVTKEVAGEGVVRQEIDGYFDGSITNEKNIMLCTIEADCTPVYILDPVKKAIGMVHSGWRGTVKGIAIKAIKKMSENYGTDIKDCIIHFGPSICKNCYEVDKDVYDEFSKIFEGEELERVISKRNDGKYLLDVAEAIRIRMIKEGIKEENIQRSKYCTFHDNIFDSWRRDGKATGHILSAIMLK